MWNLTRKTRSCLMFVVMMGVIIVGSNAKRPSKIRGAQNTAPHEGSFVVRIELTDDYYCTGAIISKRHVLTAGHCVDKLAAATVIGGTVRRYDPNSIKTKVARVYKHPQYGTGYGAYDVGIVEVDRDFDLSGRQTSEALPTSELNLDLNGFLFGWSKCGSDGISQLQKVNVGFLTKEECEDAVGAGEFPKKICVYTGTASICGGDSGGPIVSSGRVVGIATSGTNSPIVAQNVYEYLPWINSVVNQYHG